MCVVALEEHHVLPGELVEFLDQFKAVGWQFLQNLLLGHLVFRLDGHHRVFRAELDQHDHAPGRQGVAAQRTQENGVREAHAHLSDDRWLAKLADDPQLLRTPLVRWKQKLTIGDAAETWKSWIDEENG